MGIGLCIRQTFGSVEPPCLECISQLAIGRVLAVVAPVLAWSIVGLSGDKQQCKKLLKSFQPCRQ